MKQLSMVLFLIVSLICVQTLSAQETGGVTLPDSLQAGGEKLHLNGAGLRSKLFFKIYAGGLYLAASSHDAEAIIRADEPMLVRMHFIYDGVSAEKMQSGWRDGFALTAPDADASLKDAMEEFTALFTKEVKKNDVYDIAWLPDTGLEVWFNGNREATISGLDLKKALFAVWLGDKPVDEDLKEGMLGR